MFRKRLLCTGLLISMLPGCACWGDRPGLLTRFRAWRDEPATGPIGTDCGCTGTPVVYGGPVGNTGPIIMQPGNPGIPGLPPGAILPNPNANIETDPPKIPKAGIKETPGKQGELESRNPGPIIGLPVGGGK